MSQGHAVELKQTLEQEIVTGDLKPGARLDETSLAERFGVSRTPVRQALHELAVIGLVDIRPRRVAVVATIGLKGLLDMFEVMAEMEGLCGAFAARRASEDEFSLIRNIHLGTQNPLANNAPDEYYALNVTFHDAIYDAGHNAFLADQTRQLRNRLAPYRRLQLRQFNRISDSFAEHSAIVDAITSRDADAAHDLLRDHVSTQRGSFNDFVASLPDSYLAQAG